MTDGSTTSRPLVLGRRSFLLGVAALGVAACGRSSPRSARSTRSTPITVAYDSHPYQVADLWLPAATPRGILVLIHGDFWNADAGRSLLTPLARAAVDRGWAAWNIDYRPLGHGGGWPASYQDVAQAIDHLTTEAASRSLDLARTAVLGHAVGGTFALWSAARYRLPARAPGAEPKVRPALAVSVAGVNDLAAAAYEGLGDGAVSRFMGGEPTDPDGDYSAASPADMLPIGVPQVIAYGTADAIVPASQSTAYTAKARLAGDTVTVVEVAGAGHFDMVDPTRPAWGRIAAHLAPVLGS